MLGILVLFGIVKKNAILQIDHTNQLRARGMPRAEAILAGEPRPAAPDPDDDARVRRRHDPAGRLARHRRRRPTAPSARSIIGGQTLSLLLTLLATPVAYSLFDDLVEKRPFARAAGVFRRVAGRGKREQPVTAA